MFDNIVCWQLLAGSVDRDAVSITGKESMAMRKQLLFWAVAGPKYLQRFLLLWLVLMGLFVYAFVHEAFDGQAQRPLPPRPPSPVAGNG